MKATTRRDFNGNKIVYIKPFKKRGFSIQTNGNLPEVHRMELGFTWESHFSVELWKEIKNYILEFGTKYQKSVFGL